MPEAVVAARQWPHPMAGGRRVRSIGAGPLPVICLKTLGRTGLLKACRIIEQPLRERQRRIGARRRGIRKRRIVALLPGGVLSEFTAYTPTSTLTIAATTASNSGTDLPPSTASALHPAGCRSNSQANRTAEQPH